MRRNRSAPTATVSGEERRSELIRIVFNEIAEKGFEGLRFQEVAAAAGITNATLYYYFPSKEAMIQSLVEWLFSDLNKAGTVDERNLPSAKDELQAIFEDLQARVARDARFFIVITELALRAQRDPAIAKIGRERDRSWGRRLRGVLQRGIEDGSFRKDIDMDTACLALMVQLKGIAHHAAMEKRSRGEIKAVVEEITRQVIDRLTAV